jgi:hypothetical protein
MSLYYLSKIQLLISYFLSRDYDRSYIMTDEIYCYYYPKLGTITEKKRHFVGSGGTIFLLFDPSESINNYPD